MPKANRRSRFTDVVDDALWSAVGDPIRRTLLDLLLVAGDGTATSLSEQLPVTRQAVTKHLAVLDRVGLVHGTSTGRERRYAVDDEQLARAAAQLASVGSSWEGRLRRIARIAERIERQKPANNTRPESQKREKRKP
jgi:DNA-binding transcriptional ArsR family regulator